MRKNLEAVLVCAAALVGTALGAQPKEPDPPAGGKPDASGLPTWMPIPIEGDFGTEVTAAGVAAALNDAKNRKIRHAVFIIDSEGGRIDDGRAIVEVINQQAKSVQCHCVVKKAAGAALWVVATSENVFVCGKSEPLSFGLVAGKDTPEAEQTRATDALADELAKIAAAHGHSDLLFRAIVAPKAELWLTPGEKPVLVAARPAGQQAKEIDGSAMPLALTPEQAVEVGLARTIPQISGDPVGAAIGASPWRSARNAGATHMKHAATELNRLHKNFEASQKKYELAVDEMQRRMERMTAMKEKARDEDPRLQGGGSTSGWTERVNRAMANWQAVQAIAREGENYRKEALRAADAALRDATAELKFRRVPIPADAKPQPVPKLDFDPQAEIRNAEVQIDSLNRSRAGR